MQDEAWTDSEELDRLFDEGEVDILQYFDTDNVQYPGLEERTVAVDLPVRVFDALERESGKTGTPIQDLIEVWIEERVALLPA
ncbi:MAG: BrnA antitoxin family protein [Bifidobacteriaceae bacterium]|jgi:hypothetical protein|nr:BrnA antitoxin family protein [Bifidobacteriaceae bacterium]